MATRYWVGGAGTWDATTTTNWSATSGGAGGASAPTSADNVIFNTLSNATAYAVTVGTNAVAADITIAGPLAGNVTLGGSATSVINCYGSWTNAATGVAFGNTIAGAQVFFLAATTGKTVTTNIVDTASWAFVFNNAAGGWTIGSAYSSTISGINVAAGVFSTGNFAITIQNFASSGAGVRTVNLGSSTLTVSNPAGWNFATTTNLTFNAGTSTIICSNSAPTFAGGGLTYNNVQFTSSSGGSATTITGANTFNNLNQTSPTSNRRDMSIAANQTITGTFTPGAANLYSARVRVQSSNLGSPVTLTVATIATLSDVDFRDITAAGASGTWSGTRLGNGLGNTNITFVAGKTVYWNLVAGGNWSNNAWALSSGGSIATTNFPLAQDTVIIDNTGLTAGNTITMDAPWWLGTLNVTRTNAWTFSCSSSPFIYGDATLTSVTTVSGGANFTFLGQGLTQTFTTNSVSLTTGIIQQSVGGTLLLNGSVTCASTATITLNNGTLNLNNYTLTAGYFNSSNSNVRTITSGTGSFNVTGNAATVWGTGNATNLTYTTIPTVNATYSGATGTRSFSTSGLTDRINLNITAGTDTIAPITTFNVNNYNFTGFSGTLTNISTQIYGSLTLSTGMTVSAGANTFTFRSTSSGNTITSNGKTMDFPVTFDGVSGTWQLQDNMTLAAGRTTTLTNGTLDLNSKTLSTAIFSSSNSNVRTIAFGTGKIAVTALNTSVWGVDVATNLTLTGTPRVEISGAGTSGQTRGIFNGFTNGTEANSASFYVTAGVDTVQFYGTGRKYGTIDFTGFAGNFQSDNWVFTVYGNLVLTSSITGLTTTSTFSGPITFASTSATARTITTAGKTYPVALTFDGVGGTWACQDALNADGNAITLTNGTLNANNQNVSMGTFSSSNANVRTLALGVGTWTVSGAWNCATSTNLTVTGTGTINMTSATSKTFAGGGKSWPTLNQGGAGTLTITGANSFQSITNTVQSSTVVFPASTSTSVNIFKLNGIAGNLTTINSSVSGTKFTLVNNGPYETNCDYLNIKDSSATGNKWYAGNNSVNSGNNTGWIFSASSMPSNFLSFF